jgi:catalase
MSDTDKLPVAMVDAIEEFSTARQGYRRAHARGLVLAGTFQPTAEARALSAAEHFRGPAVPVRARLSNAEGDPFGADRVSDQIGRVLGLGVRFHLPSGAVASWAAASIPAFPARTPEDFLRLTQLRKPLRHPLRTISFLLTRRELLSVVKSLRATKPARSFATTRFNGVHTYFLIDDQGRRQPVRYSWRPRAGEGSLGGEEARALPPLYLLDELRRRLTVGSVAWDLLFHIPEATDPLLDASRRWPDERRSVVAGMLTLTTEEPDQGAAETLVFDPTGVVPGIELSDDPVLRFRAGVYGESYRRRSQETREEPAPPDMRQ